MVLNTKNKTKNDNKQLNRFYSSWINALSGHLSRQLIIIAAMASRWSPCFDCAGPGCGADGLAGASCCCGSFMSKYHCITCCGGSLSAGAMLTALVLHVAAHCRQGLEQFCWNYADRDMSIVGASLGTLLTGTQAIEIWGIFLWRHNDELCLGHLSFLAFKKCLS